MNTKPETERDDVGVLARNQGRQMEIVLRDGGVELKNNDVSETDAYILIESMAEFLAQRTCGLMYEVVEKGTAARSYGAGFAACSAQQLEEVSAVRERLQMAEVIVGKILNREREWHTGPWDYAREYRNKYPEELEQETK